MRIRIEFHKTDTIRFIGHLDLHKTWERIFRRAGLPLAYSQGFHPQPRLNLACALPLGITSECELLDAWLEQQVNTGDINTKIQQTSPTGILIQSVTQVGMQEPSMQSLVESVTYRVTILSQIPNLDDLIINLLNTNHFP
jgi:radical SAM-linked protein